MDNAEEVEVKIDSLGLHGSIMPAYLDGGLLVSRALCDYKLAGMKLCRQVYESTRIKSFRPGWLKDLIKQFEDLYCVDIVTGNGYGGRDTEWCLRFRCKKGDFAYRIDIHFDRLPRFWWSGSLFNFHTDSYMDIGQSIDNCEAFNGLKDYLDRFKQRCNEILAFDKQGILEPYDPKKWIVHRLDLAVDYALGPDAIVANLEKLEKVSITGYEKNIYREYSKVNFRPARRDNRPGRVKLPTINVYNKSDELINVIGGKLGHSVPKKIFEQGWLRVELQFYQGMKRKDMSVGFAEEVRKRMMDGKLTNEDFYWMYELYDVIGPKLIKGKIERVEDKETRLLLSYFRQYYGTFTMRGLQDGIGYDDEQMKGMRKVIVGMRQQNLIKRKGHQYFLHQAFYESLVAGEFVEDSTKEEK